jgi:hypothetical protein
MRGLFPDILIPNLWIISGELIHYLDAFFIIEDVDFNPSTSNIFLWSLEGNVLPYNDLWDAIEKYCPATHIAR